MEQIQRPGAFIISGIKVNMKSKFQALYKNNLADISYIMLSGILVLVLCVLINNWNDYSHLWATLKTAFSFGRTHTILLFPGLPQIP